MDEIKYENPEQTDETLSKIEGRNAVLEAFRSGRTIERLFILDGCKDGPIQSILREAKKTDAVVQFVDKDRLNRMSETKKIGSASSREIVCLYVNNSVVPV